MNLPFAQVVVVEKPNEGFCLKRSSVKGLGGLSAPSLKEFGVAAGEIIFRDPNINRITIFGPRGRVIGEISRPDPLYA